jgi:hypothetical protein
MQLYYRISDKSYDKPKLIGATKETCLMNFIMAFKDVIYDKIWTHDEPPPKDYCPPIRIFADRCERTTVKMISETGYPLYLSDSGNAGSLREAIKAALHWPDDELIYFCEDDYLHLSCAPKYLEEGIKRADYVSLYDHPDKYTRHYNGGEHCKVFKTPSSHWRTTVSTCMTFGARVKTLKEDLEIWEKYTDGDHPHDHHIFSELTQKGRRLIVPIPGVACHTDLTFANQMNQRDMMETWAVKMMARKLEEDLQNVPASTKGILDLKIDIGCAYDDDPWKMLMKMDALKQKWGVK